MFNDFYVTGLLHVNTRLVFAHNRARNAKFSLSWRHFWWSMNELQGQMYVCLYCLYFDYMLHARVSIFSHKCSVVVHSYPNNYISLEKCWGVHISLVLNMDCIDRKRHGWKSAYAIGLRNWKYACIYIYWIHTYMHTMIAIDMNMHLCLTHNSKTTGFHASEPYQHHIKLLLYETIINYQTPIMGSCCDFFVIKYWLSSVCNCQLAYAITRQLNIL